MFNQYPYLNLNDLNLDYILKAIKEMRYEVTNFVSINAIKYADPIQWDITRQYEKNTIVIDPVTGTAYISVAPVPVGVALTRPEYWTVVFDLQSFVTKANQNLANNYEEQTTTTATMNTSTGQWVIWGDVLYKALVNITAGDAYVVGSNIQRITVEDVIVAMLQDIANEVQARQDADTVLQNNINAEILARQGADTALQGNIDAEILSRQGADTALQGNIDAESLARQTADGDLSDLTTTNKDSLVDAINEVNSTGGGAIGKIGDLDDLHTADKTTVVNSINEIYDNINSYIGIDPDNYAGTDAQKIQSAYDDAVSFVNDNDCNVTIFIRRMYDLTGSTIYFHHPETSALNNHIIFMGVNNGGFYRGGTSGGHMFAARDTNINTWHDFFNLTFKGAPMVRDSRGIVDGNVVANFSHSGVFNMLRLNQMHIDHCNFANLSGVYDNRASLQGVGGSFTWYCSNNFYYCCSDVAYFGYSQNAITFINEYCGLGYRFITSNANMRSFYTLNVINCTIEYMSGMGIQFVAGPAKGIAGVNIKNSYFEGIAGPIIFFACPIQNLIIDGCTFQVAGFVTSLTEGVYITANADTQISFTNNTVMRSTAVSGYGINGSFDANALNRKFNFMGLKMLNQTNAEDDSINPTIKACLITDIQQLV